MAKLTKEEIVAALKEMTVLELNDLVKAVEEEFGVTAAAPVAAAAAPAEEEGPAAGPSDIMREVAIFKHRWPEEVLRDYRVENYWEFEDENEDVFSGYEVNKIAEEAERV